MEILIWGSDMLRPAKLVDSRFSQPEPGGGWRGGWGVKDGNWERRATGW